MNRTFTTRIVDLHENESRAALELLFRHIEDVNFQIRFRWQKNDVVFWDNRCVLHHGRPFDADRYRRRMHQTRVSCMHSSLEE